MQVTVAPEYIEPPVIVEEHRSIVELAFEFGLGPSAVLYVVSLVDIGLVRLVVGYEQRIVGTVHVAERSRPLSLAVGIAAIAEVIDVIILDEVTDIIDYLPVHQILGLHYRGNRTEVHRGADHIIRVTHPDQVIVRDISISQRVDCPGHSRFLSTGRSQEQSGGKRQHQMKYPFHIRIHIIQRGKA